MNMTWSRDGYEDDKPLWKGRRGHLLRFPDHIATEKENSSKNLGKSKEKRKGQKSGCDNIIAWNNQKL